MPNRSVSLKPTRPLISMDGMPPLKVAALSTVLMDIPLKPQDVTRQGIRDITPDMIRSASSKSERWKLVCSAQKSNGKVVSSVKPERMGADSPLYCVNGTSSYIQFELDTLPGLGILESNPVRKPLPMAC